MDESTERRTEPAARRVSVEVCGDTADEIEFAALDKARAFFGDGPQLEVVRGYFAWPSTGTEKAYRAAVRVRVVEGAPGE